MDRDDQQGQAERLEVIKFGGSDGSGWLKRRWPRWLPLVLAAGVAVAIVAYVEHGRNPATTRATHPPTAASPWWLSGPAASEAASPPPRTTEVGHPLLGVTSGWELFGRGPSGVVRIELARGRLTATAVPALGSTGPVSFIVGQDWAVIRPLDFVPGYVVPDGQPARALTGALSQGGPALPGSDRASVWVPAGDRAHPSMTLVDVDGRPTGAFVAIPDGMNREEPDQTGYLLLTGPHGVYTARPDGLHQVSTGTLLAVGPTRWLTLECDDQHRCATVVIDSNTSTRRVLDVHTGQANRVPGVISPNAATAALLETDPSGVRVHLLDLVSGADRRLDLTVDQPFEDNIMVWSPDSQWLFIAGADGRLYPVDPSTAQVHDLGVALPPIRQLAIRSTRQ